MANPTLTVYFRNFPEDIPNEDLYEIFSQYGSIVKYFVHKNRSYGMVEYEELSSCTNAILNLHGQLPLNLYVSMAKVNKTFPINNTFEKKFIPKPVNPDYQPIYYEEEYYVDENETLIPILNDPRTNTIFVPIKYAPTIKRRVRKVPYSNSVSNGDLNDDSDNCSVSSSGVRKVIDSDLLNLRVERNFADDSKISPRTVKQISKNGDTDNNNFPKNESKRSNVSSPQPSGSGYEPKPNLVKKIIKKDCHKSIKFDHDEENTNSLETVPQKTPSHNEKLSYDIVELPPNKFTIVQVVHVVNRTSGWVQICDKRADFGELMSKIVSYTSSKTKTCEAEVGKMCLAKFEDAWFRAIILTASKYVHFIDFGNDCKVEDDFLEIPSDIKSYDAFAIHINLLDGTPCEMEDQTILNIKPIRVENDVLQVQVENGLYDSNIIENLPINTNSTNTVTDISDQNSLFGCQKSMMSSLKSNVTGFFALTLKLSPTKNVGYFIPHNLGDEVNTLENISSEVEDLPSFKPKIGDLVAAELDNWKRAYILDIKDGYTVAFIDFGLIKVVQEVKPLPATFKNIPQFTCCFNSNDLHKFNLNSEYDFTITSIVQNTWNCQVEFEKNILNIKLTLWNPTVENDLNLSTPSESDISLKYLKLKNRENVIIIEEKDGYLYGRTKEASNMLKRIETYISNNITKASKLTTEPVVGQMVLAQYEETWHRAVVTNVKKNLTEFLYIDYGNDNMKPHYFLKHADEYMQKEPITLIKFKLKGFIDKPFSKECLNYFETLSEEGIILKVVFQGSVDSGVDLYTKDGKHINDELKKLNTNSNLLANKKELYMKIVPPGLHDPREMSMKLYEIPLGKQEIKYLSDVDLSSYSICICLNDPELLHMVHVELKTQMTKYAENVVPNESYTPIRDELILVEYNAKWYRGLSLECEGDQFKVFLVDYGFHDSVRTDRIRKMPKEFVENYNALGNFAFIKGVPKHPTPELIDRLKNLLLQNEIYKVEILHKDDDDNYHVIFPDLLKQLEKEKFI